MNKAYAFLPLFLLSLFGLNLDFALPFSSSTDYFGGSTAVESTAQELPLTEILFSPVDPEILAECVNPPHSYVNYEVEKKASKIKFENADIGLGEDGAYQTDKFVVEVYNGSPDVGVKVKTPDFDEFTLQGEGDSEISSLGFRVTLESIDFCGDYYVDSEAGCFDVSCCRDVYVFKVTSGCNQHALSFIEFDFLDAATIYGPSGSYDAERHTCGWEPVCEGQPFCGGEYEDFSFCLDEGYNDSTGLSSYVIDFNGYVNHLPVSHYGAQCGAEGDYRLGELYEGGEYYYNERGVIVVQTPVLPYTGDYHVAFNVLEANSSSGSNEGPVTEDESFRLTCNGETHWFYNSEIPGNDYFAWTPLKVCHFNAGVNTFILDSVDTLDHVLIEDVGLYFCPVPGPVCGDNSVEAPESCELPNTTDNIYCDQTPVECAGFPGLKSSVRDSYGNCGIDCTCIEDPREFLCHEDVCGAQCDEATDFDTDDSMCYYDCEFDETCQYQSSCSTAPYCEGNVWHYGGECSGEGCLFDSVDCISLNHYGEWETYCEGGTVRQHRLYHDYYCAPGGCDYTSYYVDDTLVEDCDLNDGALNNECGEENWGCVENGVAVCEIENIDPVDSYCEDNFCEGNERSFDGFCSESFYCGYSTEDCGIGDGNYCVNDSYEVRDYFCEPDACTYLVEDTIHCPADGWHNYGNVPGFDDPECENRDYYCRDSGLDDYCTHEVLESHDYDSFDGTYCTGDLEGTVERDYYCDATGSFSYASETPVDCGTENWSGGGDSNGFGDDVSCDYTGYFCIGTGPAAYCDSNVMYSSGFDYLDEEPVCFGPKIGKTDYWCDLGECDLPNPENDCGSGSKDYVDGCDISICGAECEEDGDCEDSGCEETYFDYCDGKRLVEYDSDKVKDSTTVSDSASNTCDTETSCSCSDNPVNCSPPDTNDYCVEGTCGAECDAHSDCSCPLDGCVGPDWYDYPGYGECTGGCECNDSILQGGGCEPVIEFNSPLCGECLVDGDCGETGNACTFYECIDYYCVETPEQLSTPCEADGDLCTIDHCDGAGECVLDERVDCSGLSDQCNTGVCEPSTGACHADPEPLSTPCENGLYCDGADHCDGLGECVALGPAIDCSGLSDQCNSGFCDENTDSCVKQPVPDQTPCDDGLWCNAGEVCFSGICANGSARDCSFNDINAIASCLWWPDGIDFTWDSREEFISECDEANDLCTEGDYTIDHECDIGRCDAGCEENSDCICPADGCRGPDYYDYPAYGECTAGCECDTGEGCGEPCEPAIDYNSSLCGECFDDADCGATGNQCTQYQCIDYSCVETDLPLSTSCENSEFCDGEDHCDGAGSCVPMGQPIDCSHLDDQCSEGVCIESTDSCESNPKPLSTPCDNDLYCDGPDHCDGLGECVALGPAIDCSHLNDQCNTGACNESIDSCEASFKPLSTPCDNGLYCDGADHCDGLGECVALGPAIDCSYLDGQCNSGFCDEGQDTCMPDYFPLSTPCENGLFCDGPDHCDGGGACVAMNEPIDCSANDILPVMQCDYSPDDYNSTWDYFAGFTSVCDENAGACTTGTETIDSSCDIQNCGAECESDADCETELIDGICFYGGVCEGEPGCACGFEEEPCPEPGTILEGYCYWGERLCEDVNGCSINKDPMICAKECDPELGPVGQPTISTAKTVGEPKIECDYLGDLNEAEECWFVTTGTTFTLDLNYDGDYAASTFYRLKMKYGYGDEWDEWGPWIEYTEPFTIPEDSIHGLEYYSTDVVCVTEDPHFEIDVVDSQAPFPEKTVGEPKTKWSAEDSIFYPEIEELCWNGEENQLECWKVTKRTPIYMHCTDPEPHPVDNEKVCFYVELDAENATEDYCGEYGGDFNAEGDGFCCLDRELEDFTFLEDSEHELEYYCADQLGNKGPLDVEKFKVEGSGFRLSFCPKWNLISVPFSLLNPAPEEVFSGVEDKVESLWTYDAVEEEWLVYSPGAPSNLDKILPGWGYWLAAYEAGEVVLGGYLIPVGPTFPPGKGLAEGWNLIGYYGTSWELYSHMEDQNFVCGQPVDEPGKTVYGDLAYCALNSLVETSAGYPKWSSLWAFINCCGEGLLPQHNPWVAVNACGSGVQGEENRMYAGRGYWIEMGEGESYAPATTCIWSSEFMCAYPEGGI